MVKGFNICLPDFCSYCGEFEPKIEKEELSILADKAGRFITDIHCTNEKKCLCIAEKLRERLQNGLF